MMVPPALSTNRRVPISKRRYPLLLSELNKELGEKATEVLVFLNERAYEHLHRKPEYIILYTARNVVIYRFLVKANKSKLCSHFSLLLCGRFERSGVPASFRAPNIIYQSRRPSHRCGGAGGVFRFRWRCVSEATQRKVWTPLSKTLLQNINIKAGPVV